MERPPPEMSLVAPGGRPLLDAVREGLGAEGRSPSRRRVAAWIAEGHVRVEGERVTDSRHEPVAGARIDLVPDADPLAAADVSGEAARAAPLPILHLDRHLLVVEVPAAAPRSAPPAATLPEHLAACLAAAGWAGRRPEPRVFPPLPRDASGLALAALGPEVLRRLEEAFATGAATAAVLARVGRLPEAAGFEVLSPEPGGGGLVLAEGAPEAVRTALAKAGCPVLGLHLHRLRLRHPRTGRRLAWEASPPPWGAAALP